jgi:hypothetical protein
MSACTDSHRPSLSERQPVPRAGAVGDSPCRSQTPVTLEGDLVGFSPRGENADASGASFEAVLAGVRGDRMKVDINGRILAQAARSPAEIDLRGHQDYQTCRACVTIALDGGIELIATRGLLAITSYQPGVAIQGELRDVEFHEFDSNGDPQGHGCTLTFPGPAALRLTPDPVPDAPAPQELGSMSLSDLMSYQSLGQLAIFLGPWAGDLTSIIAGASLPMWTRLAAWADYFGLSVGDLMKQLGPAGTYLVLYGLTEVVPLFL